MQKLFATQLVAFFAALAAASSGEFHIRAAELSAADKNLDNGNQEWADYNREGRIVAAAYQATSAGTETPTTAPATSTATASSNTTSTSSTATFTTTVTPSGNSQTTRCGAKNSGVKCANGLVNDAQSGKARKCKINAPFSHMQCNSDYCCNKVYKGLQSCSEVVTCPAGYRRESSAKDAPIRRCKNRADSGQACTKKYCCLKA